MSQVCHALHRNVRNFYVFGLSGTGKSNFFEWLHQNSNECSYFDCKRSLIQLGDLSSALKTKSDHIFIIDHLSEQQCEQIVPLLNQNRKNIIFMVGLNGALKLNQKTIRIAFFPMGSALASTLIEQELMFFENRHQRSLSAECKQFIRSNHFGMRSFVGRFFDVCEQSLAESSKLLPELQESLKELLAGLPFDFDLESASFPFGLESEALIRIESLWNRLQIGLNHGWMSRYADAYVLHGIFNYVKLSDSERLSLQDMTRDPLRRYYLLNSHDDKARFLEEHPLLNLLITNEHRTQPNSLDSEQLGRLEDSASSPFRDALLILNDITSNQNLNWPQVLCGRVLQPLFEQALKRDDRAYQEHFIFEMSRFQGNCLMDEKISYLNDWQAQIYLRQGNYYAAQKYWYAARFNALAKRELMILLHQYLGYIADLDMVCAIPILEELKKLDATSKEACLARGIDRIISGDFLAAGQPMSELEELEINQPHSEVAEYMIFLGYLEQKINSPWTYLRFRKKQSDAAVYSISPGVQLLFEEIDRRFCYCFNRNGKLLISHAETLRTEYAKRQSYDLFFDFNQERYYEKKVGLLKIEKSRISLLLFCLLAFFPGRRFSWSELYESIYAKDYNPELDEGTIRMAVTRLKKSIESADESYFGISLVNQEIYLKASTKYCVIILDEEIQELHHLALKLKVTPGEKF